MLAAVRWRAVLLGFGLGTLAVAGLALLLWLVLAGLAVEGAADIATTLGTLGGLALAGWLAGGRAPFSGWFHGAIAALGIALVVVVTARMGGSPAPTATVLLLAALAVTLGGVAGHLGWARSFRRRTSPPGGLPAPTRR